LPPTTGLEVVQFFAQTKNAISKFSVSFIFNALLAKGHLRQPVPIVSIGRKIFNVFLFSTNCTDSVVSGSVSPTVFISRYSSPTEKTADRAYSNMKLLRYFSIRESLFMLGDNIITDVVWNFLVWRTAFAQQVVLDGPLERGFVGVAKLL